MKSSTSDKELIFGLKFSSLSYLINCAQLGSFLSKFSDLFFGIAVSMIFSKSVENGKLEIFWLLDNDFGIIFWPWVDALNEFKFKLISCD